MPYAFWAKIAAFGIVGLLSIGPTRRIAAWQKSAKADAIPIFAAAMARGIGYTAN